MTSNVYFNMSAILRRLICRASALQIPMPLEYSGLWVYLSRRYSPVWFPSGKHSPFVWASAVTVDFCRSISRRANSFRREIPSEFKVVLGLISRVIQTIPNAAIESLAGYFTSLAQLSQNSSAASWSPSLNAAIATAMQTNSQNSEQHFELLLGVL